MRNTASITHVRDLRIPPQNGVPQGGVGLQQCLDVPLLVLDQVSGGRSQYFTTRFTAYLVHWAIFFAVSPRFCTAPQLGHDLIFCHVVSSSKNIPVAFLT
jgi:hypothetical protein